MSEDLDLRVSTKFIWAGKKRKFFYDPQPDITTFELARIWMVTVAPRAEWLEQNPDLIRHFTEA